MGDRLLIAAAIAAVAAGSNLLLPIGSYDWTLELAMEMIGVIGNPRFTSAHSHPQQSLVTLVWLSGCAFFLELTSEMPKEGKLLDKSSSRKKLPWVFHVADHCKKLSCDPLWMPPRSGTTRTMARRVRSDIIIRVD